MRRENVRRFHGLPNSADELVKLGPIVAAKMQPDLQVQQYMLDTGVSIEAQQVDMLVDTGASLSMLDSRVVHRLRLRAIRPASVLVANNEIASLMVHRGSICIPMDMADDDVPGSPGRRSSEMVMFEILVASVPPGRGVAQHDGLIGRAFLQRFNLLYDGTRGRFGLRTELAP